MAIPLRVVRRAAANYVLRRVYCVSFEVTPADPGGVGVRFPEGGERETHDYAIFAHLRRHYPIRDRLSGSEYS